MYQIDINISKILKQRGIKRFRKLDAPKSTPEQQQRQKDRLNALVLNDFKPGGRKDIIYDDESYFPFQSGKISSNQYYYAENKENVPLLTQFQFRKKFEKKFVCGSQFQLKVLVSPILYKQIVL